MTFERGWSWGRDTVTLVAALILIASPARADGGEAEVALPAPQTPAPPDAKLERARRVVAVAERLFAAEHYGAALAEYERAYEVLDGHPRQFWVLHNLAACNERLFRYDLAVQFYEEYLRRAPSSEEDRAAVAAIIRTLRSLLATLEVESRVAGEIWVDDRRIGTAPGRWLVPTGRHVVELRAPLHETERRDVDLSSVRATKLSFEPRQLSTYRGPAPVYFWTAVAASGVAVVTGATFGGLALKAHSDGREQADLYQDTTDESQRTRTFAAAADVGFGAALVFGVTATVLYFVTDWSPRAPQGRGHQTPTAARVAGRPRGLVLEF